MLLNLQSLFGKTKNEHSFRIKETVILYSKTSVLSWRTSTNSTTLLPFNYKIGLDEYYLVFIDIEYFYTLKNFYTPLRSFNRPLLNAE